ncbi:hypothetical protein BpPP18_07080 [Weizmannia acidilactici]|nr:hypothetical protein BpPP18_07080 [Weizmannia acidilactici]
MGQHSVMAYNKRNEPERIGFDEGICQKVYKVKITTDLRKYTAPARGSKAWKTIFKRRRTS